MKNAILLTCMASAAFLQAGDFEKDSIVWAASKGDLPTVQYHIQQDPRSILKRDKNDNTALSWAASRGYSEIVHLLLDTAKELKQSCAVLRAEDSRGSQPIGWTVINHHDQITELLLDVAQEAGCLKDILLHKDNEGKTIAHWAVGKGNRHIFALILEKGRKARCVSSIVQSRTNEKVTLLMDGIRTGKWEIVQDVLDIAKSTLDSRQLTAFIDAQETYANRSALHWVLRFVEGSVEKESPLHSEDDMLKITREILKYPGVNLMLEDDKGYTPIYWASFLGKQNILHALKTYYQAQALAAFNQEAERGYDDQVKMSSGVEAQHADKKRKK